MNAAAHHTPYEPALENGLTKPLLQSAIFHLVLFGLTFVAIPFVSKDPVRIITPVSVELVKAVPDTRTASPQPVAEPEPPEDVLQPPEPPPPPPEPEPETTETVKETPPPPKPEPKKKEKPKPKEPPKEKPKDKEKPKEKSFDQLLKDFTPREKTEEAPRPKPKEPAKAKSESAIPDFATQMTRSELEAVQGGISPCWNVDGGSRFAENLVVELRVTVFPDMRVKTVTIADQIRYAADPAFRAAADAASRALRNPRCSTLRLPPEKFQNQSFKFIFDPREMLGYR